MTLTKIASGLGKPMHVDEYLRAQSRISYAWILVTTDVTQAMPDIILVIEPSRRVFDQSIKYD